ncbi:MAG: nucleotidyltransferase family protein [Candidatus Diapherotrites archaeon]|nr:nucleotidyltransferase family protein [Candidatus Diapherotrites archaeon]
MKAVVLAAGEGVRMRPLTLNTPKPLLEVNGKALLEYTLELLPKSIDEVVIVEGYLGEKIRSHFGARFDGKNIQYVHQPVKNGTFRALELCRPLLDEEHFLMLFADDLFGPKSFERCVEKKGMCILTAHSKHPERFGTVELNADGTLKELIEKPKIPKSNYVYCGPAVLGKELFDFAPKISENGECYVPEAIHLMAQKWPVHVAIADAWLPIGYPEDLKNAEVFLEKLE